MIEIISCIELGLYWTLARNPPLSDLQNRLQLDKYKVNMAVSGINNTSTHLNHECTITMQAQHNSFQAKLDCFVIPEITSYILSTKIVYSDFNIPKHSKLTDPYFHLPQKVDLLIGSDYFWSMICTG